jgi:hypothetical protein
MENLKFKVSYARLVEIVNEFYAKEFHECIFNKDAETQFIHKLVSEMTPNETWQDVTGIESGKPDTLLDTARVSGLSMYSTFKAPVGEVAFTFDADDQSWRLVLTSDSY